MTERVEPLSEDEWNALANERERLSDEEIERLLAIARDYARLRENEVECVKRMALAEATVGCRDAAIEALRAEVERLTEERDAVTLSHRRTIDSYLAADRTLTAANARIEKLETERSAVFACLESAGLIPDEFDGVETLGVAIERIVDLLTTACDRREKLERVEAAARALRKLGWIKAGQQRDVFDAMLREADAALADAKETT